jgi:thioredoxin 1
MRHFILLCFYLQAYAYSSDNSFSSTSIKVLDQVNFESEVLKQKGYVLVDFYSNSCPPCRYMDPILKKLNNDFQGFIKFAKVNVQVEYELARKYQILSIPTFILFNDGQVVKSFIGSMPEMSFKENLLKYTNY